MSFKDHFSAVAADYATFRPTQPAELLDWIVGLAPARRVAWDCGTGNGQVAVALAERFEQVEATDASEAQLAHAPARPNVTYRVARAEASGIAAASVDLITVAQAVHWFDIDTFHREATRVLVPGGAIVEWTYQTPTVSPEPLGAVFDRFATVAMGTYWPRERQLINDGYRTYAFPFDEVDAPAFELRVTWTLAQLAGYLRTWSAVAQYVAAHGGDPVAEFERDALAAIGDPATAVEVCWPYAVRAGHKPAR